MHITVHTNDHQAIIVKTKTFAGGERHIQLYDLPDQLPDFFNVHCRIDSSNALMDILLLHNALNNHYGCEVRWRLEIPYLPYARQDRVCATGQAFSLQVMSQLLTGLKIEYLQVWDCHSSVGLSLTGAVNVMPVEIIQNCHSLTDILKHRNSVLICPDKGAVKRCQRICDRYQVQEMVVCEKIRDPESGVIIHTEVMADDVKGKHAIIIDDICDGGSTVTRIAKELKKMQVDRITFYVTHGIFRKGLSIFDGLIDEIYTTNSFVHSPDEKLTVIEFDSAFLDVINPGTINVG